MKGSGRGSLVHVCVVLVRLPIVDAAAFAAVQLVQSLPVKPPAVPVPVHA